MIVAVTVVLSVASASASPGRMQQCYPCGWTRRIMLLAAHLVLGSSSSTAAGVVRTAAVAVAMCVVSVPSSEFVATLVAASFRRVVSARVTVPEFVVAGVAVADDATAWPLVP